MTPYDAAPYWTGAILLGAAILSAAYSKQGGTENAVAAEAPSVVATADSEYQRKAVGLYDIARSGLGSTNMREIENVAAAVKSNMPGVEDGYIVLPSPINGVYALVSRDNRVAYIDRDAEHVISGPLVEVKTGRDLTEAQRADLEAIRLVTTNRAAASRVSAATPDQRSVATQAGERQLSKAVLDSDDWSHAGLIPGNLKPDNYALSQPVVDAVARVTRDYVPLIRAGLVNVDTVIRSQVATGAPDDRYSHVYRPDGQVNDVITVFADPTCPKCQQFHEDLPSLLDAGVQVNYVLFPRNPGASDIKHQIEVANCQPDPSLRAAMIEQLYAGEVIDGPVCDNGKVESALASLEFYKIEGTPTIMVRRNGVVYPGFVPAEDILEQMNPARPRSTVSSK